MCDSRLKNRDAGNAAAVPTCYRSHGLNQPRCHELAGCNAAMIIAFADNASKNKHVGWIGYSTGRSFHDSVRSLLTMHVLLAFTKCGGSDSEDIAPKEVILHSKSEKGDATQQVDSYVSFAFGSGLSEVGLFSRYANTMHHIASFIFRQSSSFALRQPLSGAMSIQTSKFDFKALCPFVQPTCG